jgi:hypothetical protein
VGEAVLACSRRGDDRMFAGASGWNSHIFAMTVLKPQMVMSNWLMFVVILSFAVLLALAFIFVLLFVHI